MRHVWREKIGYLEGRVNQLYAVSQDLEKRLRYLQSLATDIAAVQGLTPQWVHEEPAHWTLVKFKEK